MSLIHRIFRINCAGARLILPVLCAGMSAAHAQIISTPNTLYRVAGGMAGSNDGTGASAQFNVPIGIVKGTDGNLYVADQQNHRIRKITPAGVVTTFVGNGTCAIFDGMGTAARVCFPTAIASDAAGNLYLADYGNNAIRKITLAGEVTTIAGNGLCGSSDGTGSVARFCTPAGITVDTSGDLYVADTGNQIIRKILMPFGTVTPIAGTVGPPGPPCGGMDGIGTAAVFCNPSGIAMDAAGNLYVSDTQNHAIRKITPSLVVSTFAGVLGSAGSADGTGAAARFNIPFGLAVDPANNLYVGDTTNSTVRKITPAAAVSTVVGTAGTAVTALGSLPGTIANPYGIALVGGNQLAFTTSNQHEVLGANFGAAIFNFSGFFQPVDNLPTVNSLKAGSTVPVKFSLGGNQGLNIFEAGYPVSQRVACETSLPSDAIEQTVNPGGSTLGYDPVSDQYNYVWKTDKSWANTCRQLVVRLSDGTEHMAVFKMK